jgi:lipoprotein-anchoring transpeptidase ErfK/SrfK
MSWLFFRWSLRVVLAVLVWLQVSHGQLLAESDGLPQSSPPDSISTPPLPEVKPQIGPPLTYGYHQETELPTTTEKWIDVDLSEQRVVAYEGAKPVRAFIVSTGLPQWPTVTGTFRIRIKTESQTMSGGSKEHGDYYYLPNVQWVQYFYEDYAFHGTYWHNNFGRPMSHGCINMTNEDAKWLFDWAGPTWEEAGPAWQKPTAQNPGTLVVIHE